MGPKLSRRLFLKRTLALGLVGGGVLGVKGAQEGLGLLEQHQTWVEASRPNNEFFDRHYRDLQRLTLGGSFAPEQFGGRSRRQEAMPALEFAVKELGMRQLRLGLRWNRVQREDGSENLDFYRPYIDYCLTQNVDICLNPGPVRVFRWPEEHVPRWLLSRLDDVPANGVTINLQQPLAQAALEHLDALLQQLDREYGKDLRARVCMVQAENEPYYPLGDTQWRFSAGYMQEVVRRLHAAYPDADVLVTSAARLHLNIIRDLFSRLMAADPSLHGRLVSGFDFHYKTPLRDSMPIVRHFDQIAYSRPLIPTTDTHVRDARTLGFRIEVTEGQCEPYAYLKSPGNSAKDLRFLILRLMDRVLDPKQPALIRLWGIEELAKRFLRGEATREHERMLEIIRAVNFGLHPEVTVLAQK
jgi:hypothetical protein